MLAIKSLNFDKVLSLVEEDDFDIDQRVNATKMTTFMLICGLKIKDPKEDLD